MAGGSGPNHRAKWRILVLMMLNVQVLLAGNGKEHRY
jgi:hypothetical protein